MKQSTGCNLCNIGPHTKEEYQTIGSSDSRSTALDINHWNKFRNYNWIIWVRSRNCGCLVTWFCYQLIAKPGNKTAAVSWPDPYPHFPGADELNALCFLLLTGSRGSLRGPLYMERHPPWPGGGAAARLRCTQHWLCFVCTGQYHRHLLWKGM